MRRHFHRMFFVANLASLIFITLVCAQDKAALAEEIISFSNSETCQVTVRKEAGILYSTEELTAPKRFVLDLLEVKAKRTFNITPPKHCFIYSIRLGAHPKMQRIVFDLHNQATIKIEDISANSIKLLVSSLSSIAKEPANTVAALAVAPAASSTVLEAPSHKYFDLIALSFFKRDTQPVIKLEFNGLGAYKVIKRDFKSYQLQLKKCKINQASLLLPYYAPQDFTGFAFIHPKNSNVEESNQVSSTQDDLCLFEIGVDHGAKLNHVVEGNTLILSAISN